MASQKTKKVDVSIPVDVVEKMDKEISKGVFSSRSHCVKFALLKLFDSSKGKLDHYS